MNTGVVCHLVLLVKSITGWLWFWPLGHTWPGGVLSLPKASVCQSVWLSVLACPGHCWDNIHDNCFIFSWPYMKPVHCNFNLTFYYDLYIEMFVQTISQKNIINSNCFIFSKHFNLIWDLCTMWSVWPFVLCPWNYDLWIWNLVYKLLFSPPNHNNNNNKSFIYWW